MNWHQIPGRKKSTLFGFSQFCPGFIAWFLSFLLGWCLKDVALVLTLGFFPVSLALCLVVSDMTRKTRKVW